MSQDLHDLRVGDLVIRETEIGGRIERHVGEVVMIKVRIRYPDVGYRWEEWWCASSGTLANFRAGGTPAHRLKRAMIDQSDRREPQ